MRKLYKISLTLNSNGLKWNTYEYDSIETEKTIKYKVNDKDKTIHKSTLMKLSDKIIPSTKFIATSIFCYDNELITAKELVKSTVYNQIIEYKNDVEKLYPYIL